MRDPGKVAAAMEVIEDFESRRVPMKTCLADWGRAHRFAGSKDRAWISGLCLDVLRRQGALKWRMGESPRAQVLGALRWIWGWTPEKIAEDCATEPHGAGALSEEEIAALAPRFDSHELDHVPEEALDFPAWLLPAMKRAFPETLQQETAAFGARAPVDLRVNTVKADVGRVVKALEQQGAEALEIENALRLPMPEAHLRMPDIISTPAYQKGWVEVQDAGSQLVCQAAGDIAGAQVLDYCAGAGGKSLALAAMMQGRGQVFAYDVEARRLAPIFERIRRAGVHNIQVRSPAENGDLSDLEGKMDVVFIDAPCTGAGTWRRHPDTKWRLTEAQMETRLGEQREVLTKAAPFVKPGGKLVYVTCSFFVEENEDQLEAFMKEHDGFEIGALPESITSRSYSSKYGARLTPLKTSTDGFFVGVLVRK